MHYYYYDFSAQLPVPIGKEGKLVGRQVGIYSSASPVQCIGLGVEGEKEGVRRYC